jgi:glycosyltransferase involved in cell wall biosynthesis
MKVLFFASYFPKPHNPVMGTWALKQAQALVRQGISLQVVSYTSWVPKILAFSSGARAYAHCPAEYEWPLGVNVSYPGWFYYPVPPWKEAARRHPIPYLTVAWQSARQSLMRLIEQYQPDLFFCHHSLPNGWVLAQLPESHRRPLIVLDHDFDEITDCHRYPQRKTAFATVVQRADLMLAVSQRMEQDLRCLFPSINAMTLHNGVDLPSSSLLTSSRPRDYQAKQVILACALFTERKGVPLLIEAFHRIMTKHPNAILRIIGSGPEQLEIEKTIARLNISQSVQMLGKRSHLEVQQEMLWADCFALVGWDEPFATVYLEAMAAGKPIIYCHDGGITDVVRDGVHGYQVPPKDVDATAMAIDRMLSNTTTRLEMGKNARDLVEKHLTWDTKAAELIDLFEVAQRKYGRERLFSLV